MREIKYKQIYKNRTKEAEQFIERINKTHSAMKNELQQQKIDNKYKDLIEDDMKE